jgi:hypothetical protein
MISHPHGTHHKTSYALAEGMIDDEAGKGFDAAVILT